MSFQVRVCSNPDVLNKTSFALEVATTVLVFYETFYGVLYPLEKQGVFNILAETNKQEVEPKNLRCS